MAIIYPFKSYRYTPAAGDLADLVTQPYDKISPAMQKRYLSQSSYNLVRVILGERFPWDTENDNVYTRAAGYLNDWTNQGILAQESEPSLYVYFQEFTLPDSTERLTRKGFIGLGKLEEYSAQIVHRHEQTLSGPKKDRTELLNHTRAHFGPAGHPGKLRTEAGRGGLTQPAANTIRLRSSPMPRTSVSIRSPGLRNSGGVRAKPTPSGVPVAMSEPGRSVKPLETHSIIASTG